MAELAILGHVSRGKEVIEILEMLGGKNSFNISNTHPDNFYRISGGDIYGEQMVTNPHSTKTFTLEQFLDKFPYKVGDKVLPICYSHPVPRVIERMWWDGSEVCYYTKNDGDEFVDEDLQPYVEQSKEKDMEAIKCVTE